MKYTTRNEYLLQATPEGQLRKDGWPLWLDQAWTTSTGEPGSFSPLGGGGFLAVNRAGTAIRLSLGDFVTPRMVN